MSAKSLNVLDNIHANCLRNHAFCFSFIIIIGSKTSDRGRRPRRKFPSLYGNARASVQANEK